MFRCERNHGWKEPKLFKKGVMGPGNTHAMRRPSKERKYIEIKHSARKLKLQATTDVSLSHTACFTNEGIHRKRSGTVKAISPHKKASIKAWRSRKYGYQTLRTKNELKSPTKLRQIHATSGPLYTTRTWLKQHRNLIE